MGSAFVVSVICSDSGYVLHRHSECHCSECHYAECLYTVFCAECSYAICRHSERRCLIVIMLSVICSERCYA
jgi:hypothetical protein